MVVVGLIPARGGSKGIPKKSIADCASKPLLSYTCAAARDSGYIDRVIVSTDDDEIAAAAREYGVEVPFRRPSELARDDTPMIGVIQHALKWLEQSSANVKAVVLLQPTSPLRETAHIDEAIKLFLDTKAATVVSVVEVPHQFNPVSLLEMHQGCLVPYLRQPGNDITRRQDKPKLYARNGPAILVAKPDGIRAGQLYAEPTIGYLMGHRVSLDIDTVDDLKLAELLLTERNGD